MQESRERASDMLQLLKKAKDLSTKKCYDVEEVRNQTKTSKRFVHVCGVKMFHSMSKLCVQLFCLN